MAKKNEGKTGVKNTKQTTKSVPVTEKMVSVSFRTRAVQKKKAEKIFADMGITMSGALNMFLAQVVTDKGMPFLPSTIGKKNTESVSKTMGESENLTGDSGLMTLEELWNEL